jgi:hypothetical protein
VTLTTDGLRDYVQIPGGQKLILGLTTVLKFITTLNQHRRLTRTLLDGFIEHGEVMLTVDLDQMYALLASRRRKWADNDPARSLMGQDQRTEEACGSMDEKILNTRLAAIEDVVSKLDGRLRVRTESTFERLRTLTANLGTPESVTTASPEVVAAVPVSTPSLESLQANTTLADEILFKVEATEEKVARLVQAGRKFNASAAREDLYNIANRVAEIVNNVDLASDWVGADLSKLADDANRIHGLFAEAKV